MVFKRVGFQSQRKDENLFMSLSISSLKVRVLFSFFSFITILKNAFNDTDWIHFEKLQRLDKLEMNQLSLP